MRRNGDQATGDHMQTPGDIAAPVRFARDLVALLVDRESVRPHPQNPRNGDVDAIIASILANGVYRPIIAQRSTSRILAGHHLHAALCELDSPMVPVMWVDCDDVTATRILLADNRTADLGRYDEGLLRVLLHELDDLDQLMGTGYEAQYLTRLDAFLDPPPRDLIDQEAWTTFTIACPVTVRDAFLGMTDGKTTGARLQDLMIQAGWSG